MNFKNYVIKLNSLKYTKQMHQSIILIGDYLFSKRAGYYIGVIETPSTYSISYSVLENEIPDFDNEVKKIILEKGIEKNTDFGISEKTSNIILKFKNSEYELIKEGRLPVDPFRVPLWKLGDTNHNLSQTNDDYLG